MLAGLKVWLETDRALRADKWGHLSSYHVYFWIYGL